MGMSLIFEKDADFGNLVEPASNSPLSGKQQSVVKKIQAFSNSKQKFSATTPKPEQVQVTRVSHKAVIEVNEEGTEAAAATAVTTTRLLPPSTNVVVDRPFMFLLRYGNLNLFMGRVMIPEL